MVEIVEPKDTFTRTTYATVQTSALQRHMHIFKLYLIK